MQFLPNPLIEKNDPKLIQISEFCKINILQIGKLKYGVPRIVINRTF